MASHPKPTPPSFELTFRPSIELISIVRHFVADFYRKVTNEDAASRLALATHELLENAAKYSTDGAAELGVCIDAAEGTVSIRMKNRASPERIRLLRGCFDEMASAASAAALYADMLRRTAVRETGSGGPGPSPTSPASDPTLQPPLQ